MRIFLARPVYALCVCCVRCLNENDYKQTQIDYKTNAKKLLLLLVRDACAYGCIPNTNNSIVQWYSDKGDVYIGTGTRIHRIHI